MLNNLCCHKRRYVIICLISISLYQGSSSRNMLTTVMRLLQPHRSHDNETEVCRVNHSETETPNQHIRGYDYGWNREVIDETIRFFYLGYLFSHGLGGYFADKYGAKHIITFAIVMVAVIQFITVPLVDGTQGKLFTLTILRICHGLVEGVRIPASMTLMAHWVPKRERARMMAFVSTGVISGQFTPNLIAVSIIQKYKDWAYPFYISGITGTVFAVIWLVAADSYTSSSQYIEEKEKSFLKRELRHVTDSRKSFPMKRIICSLQVIVLCFGITGQLWSMHFSEMFVKVYMRDVLHYDLARNLIFISVPFSLMVAFTLSSGFVSDWAHNNNKATQPFLRKLFTTIALMGGPIYMVVGSYCVCHLQLGKFFFMISSCLGCFALTGIRIVPIDLAANYAGFLTGYSMTPPLILVAFMPQIGKLLVPNATLYEYRKVFYLTLVICSVSCLIFVTLGSPRTQEWNDQPKRSKNKRDETEYETEN